VAGLGALGGSIAHHLARRGIQVIGLDLYEPPHTRGSSHGESRIIREAYFEHPSYVPLVRRAYEAWAALEREQDRTLLRITGAILLGPPNGVAVGGARRSAEAHGIAHRVLDAAGIRREFPELRPDQNEVGLHELRAGVLDPEACVAAHLRGAARHGAELRYREPLLRWEAAPGGGVVAITAGAKHEADALVLAAGPWLPRIVPTLALEVERQVMLWFRPRARSGEFTPERFPAFLWERPDGVFYGVPDLGTGVKTARHHGGRTVPDVDRLTDGVDPDDITQVRRFLERSIPAAAGDLAASSVCRYTNTSDAHFIIDQHPDHAGVWVASACSGHGFKFSSVLGSALADELITGRPDPDLHMFRWRTAVRRV
jgi:sarcosine oxidase